MNIFKAIRVVKKHHAKVLRFKHLILSWDCKAKDVIVEYRESDCHWGYVRARILVQLEDADFHEVTGHVD